MTALMQLNQYHVSTRQAVFIRVSARVMLAVFSQVTVN